MSSRLAQVLTESGVLGFGVRLFGRQLRQLSATLDRAARRISSPRDPGTAANAPTRAWLARNRDLADRLRGQRAFVLASGPSTLGLDLTRLRGSPVLAVNEMFLRLEREGIPSPFLVVMDSCYYQDQPGYRRFLADMSAAAAKLDAEVFLPVAGSAELERRGLFTARTPRFLMQVGHLLDYPSAEATPALDFSRPVPGCYTVSHMAVALALYMGCAEVVVLGVDMDYIGNPLAPIRHGYGDNPYNDHDSLSAAAAFKRDAGWDFPALLRQAADQQAAFARLAEIARLRGQRVINATPGGFLHTLERQPYDSLFTG